MKGSLKMPKELNLLEIAKLKWKDQKVNDSNNSETFAAAASSNTSTHAEADIEIDSEAILTESQKRF